MPSLSLNAMEGLPSSPLQVWCSSSLLEESGDRPALLSHLFALWYAVFFLVIHLSLGTPMRQTACHRLCIWRGWHLGVCRGGGWFGDCGLGWAGRIVPRVWLCRKQLGSARWMSLGIFRFLQVFISPRKPSRQTAAWRSERKHAVHLTYSMGMCFLLSPQSSRQGRRRFVCFPKRECGHRHGIGASTHKHECERRCGCGRGEHRSVWRKVRGEMSPLRRAPVRTPPTRSETSRAFTAAAGLLWMMKTVRLAKTNGRNSKYS